MFLPTEFFVNMAWAPRVTLNEGAKNYVAHHGWVTRIFFPFFLKRQITVFWRRENTFNSLRHAHAAYQLRKLFSSFRKENINLQKSGEAMART